MSRQSSKPRPEDIQSSCFRHPQKGCDLVWFGYYKKNKKYIKTRSGIDEMLGIEQRAYLELERYKHFSPDFMNQTTGLIAGKLTEELEGTN